MSFKVDYTTLTATDASNRFISLTGTPLLVDNVAVDTISGTAQEVNGDFKLDGTIIRWDSTSYGLYDQLASGDKLRVIFDRS